MRSVVEVLGSTATRSRLLVALTTVVLFGAACGGDGDGGGGGGGAGGGSLAKYDLSGAEITVGSKEFTEQLILGQITIQALEAAGATVEDQTGLVGSTTVRKALESGEIDLYWEYTGTGWITHLGHTDPVKGEKEQYEAVAKEDLEKNGIKWLAPAGFNNTYALAAATETVDELGVKTLSDYGALADQSPEDASLCGAAEFLTRNDGLPGLEKAYGFNVPEDVLAEVELGVIPKQVDEGDPCNFGEVFATDARIASLDLTVLEDDKDFFPAYEPAVNVREELLEQYPDLEGLFGDIAAALDHETMLELNAKVDVEGQFEEQVAEEWLVSEGFIEG